MLCAMPPTNSRQAYEMTLAEGLRFERRTFHGLFATNDQKEGAFHSTEIIIYPADPHLHRHGCIRREEEG
jgi:hypothetical protein